jgi:hypothetical protein
MPDERDMMTMQRQNARARTVSGIEMTEQIERVSLMSEKPAAIHTISIIR